MQHGGGGGRAGLAVGGAEVSGRWALRMGRDLRLKYALYGRNEADRSLLLPRVLITADDEAEAGAGTLRNMMDELWPESIQAAPHTAKA